MPPSSYSPEIQARIDRLPASAREYIQGPEIGKAVHDIGTKYRLHLDKVGALEAEIFSTMIGIASFEEFPENIVDILEVDKEIGDQITKDVNDLIFIKVRDSMKTADISGPAQAVPSMPAAVASAQPSTLVIPTAPAPQPLAAVLPIHPQSPPTIPTPPATFTPTTPTAHTPTPAAPASKPVDVASETMLSTSTTSIAPATGAQAAPQGEKPIVKVDPYREPVE